ncbi:MAG: hypothetical protein NWE89_14635 [Candidatus Bathyarchaeota archaeon]|nr:hypothetical protein [Candidatus Bathyarchaeota archaeon]
MVDVQSVSVIVGGFSLALGVLYAILFSRQYMAARITDLKTRQAELHLDYIRYITDERVDEALTDILWRWQWTDYDDYWEKYSPTSNPDANVTRRVARNYYVSLATLLRRGLIDLELIYQLNPSGVTRYWDKIGPIAREFRIRNDYPDYLEPVEFLANEISKLRKSKGYDNPKPLKENP